MTKLNETTHNKLQIQTQEALAQEMSKLASAVSNSLETECQTNSYDEMSDDIHKDLWKIATKLMIFHNIENADIYQIDQSLISWAEKLADDLEKTLGVSSVKGPLEDKLPGEK